MELIWRRQKKNLRCKKSNCVSCKYVCICIFSPQARLDDIWAEGAGLLCCMCLMDCEPDEGQTASVSDESLYSNLNGKLKVRSVFLMRAMRPRCFPWSSDSPSAVLQCKHEPIWWNKASLQAGIVSQRATLTQQTWHQSFMSASTQPTWWMCHRTRVMLNSCQLQRRCSPADCDLRPSYIKLKRPQRECKFQTVH